MVDITQESRVEAENNPLDEAVFGESGTRKTLSPMTHEVIVMKRRVLLVLLV